MSHSIIYDLPRNELTPGPRLSISSGTDSLVTASMDFRCVKGDLSAVKGKLEKGTPISTLYTEIGAGFSYLVVDSYDAVDEPGGVTVVTVRFKGIGDAGDDAQFDGGDVTYSRNDSLQEEPIFNCPNYVNSDTSSYEREAIRLTVKGILYAPVDGEPYKLRRVKDDTEFLEITNADAQWWFDYIVTKGNHTWNAPVSEWTKSATGKSKLSDSDLSNFGWIDTPPGSPAAPFEHKWQFSGATENITVQGDGANSYSLSWTSGRLEPNVYDKPSSS